MKWYIAFLVSHRSGCEGSNIKLIIFNSALLLFLCRLLQRTRTYSYFNVNCLRISLNLLFKLTLSHTHTNILTGSGSDGWIYSPSCSTWN